MSLRELPIQELHINPMTLILDEWMLVTAGNKESGYNTMTACRGQIGAVWGQGRGLPVATVYIRPRRYTKEYMDREPFYTLSFFPEEYRKQLAYLGTHSGRNGDKVADTGLTPVFDGDCTYFAEAKLVIVCRKLYRETLTRMVLSTGK